MPVDHKLIRNSENFKGLDKRSSDLARTREYATDMLNAAYRKTGAINKRKGFKVNLKKQFSNPQQIEQDVFYGASTLRLVDALNGSVSEEIIAVNKSRAYKLLDYPFNISYEGNSDVYISLIPDDTQFKFQVKVQDTLLYNKDLGTGLSNTFTISQLKQDLDALQFTTAIIPNDTFVGTPTQVPNTTNVFDYTINIPESYVNNPILLKVDETVKIDTEHNSLLTIQSVGINYNAQDEISSYDIVLRGSSFTLNNLNTQGQGIEIKLNEYNDINVTVDSAANNFEAALMDLTVNTVVQPSSLGGTNLFIKDWEQLEHGNTYINAQSANASGNYITWDIEGENRLVTNELENASFAQINNVMYISNGYEEVLKYDGEYIYSAGLPNTDKSLFTIPSTGGSTTDSSNYKIVYEYTDYKGNIISSQPSEEIVLNNTTSSPNNTITWSVNNFLNTSNGSGIFKTKDTRGTFNADVVTNNVLVKDKHPLYDSLPNSNAATDVQKAKDEKRLRVKIYRSKKYDTANGVVGQYYLVADLPYDGASYTDTTTDDALNVFLALVEPIKRHDPPPKGKYLSIFKNCLTTAGNPKDVNNVRYSLPSNASTGEIGSEYFPDDENGIIIDSPFGDKITAIAPLRDLLYIFHTNSISVLGGQINLLEQPVSELLTREGGIGCVSFHSIQEVKNTLYFLSEQGVYSIDASNAVQEASSLINTLFVDKDLKKKRAVTVNWTDKDLIVMQLPKEAIINTVDNKLTHTVQGSLVIVYDYYKDAWLKWDNIDMAGAGLIYKNNLSFLTRTSQGSEFKTMSTTDTKYDYSDHTDAIDFQYETNWESLGEPTVPKKFLRLKMYAFDTDLTFESPGFNMLIGIQKDYISSNLGEINFDFNTLATEGWGVSAWGEFGWGSAARPFLKSKLVSGKTKSLKLKFNNTNQNENVLVTNYEFEIAAPYGMEIKD
tara:strand:- start:4879 stop:7716 length:2838 start_codon:yes stop_codon:yes gene_type:complete